MAARTQLWPYGGPGRLYGSFAGKATSGVIGGIELRATVDIVPALQLETLDIVPALAASAEVTPALRGSIVIH